MSENLEIHRETTDRDERVVWFRTEGDGGFVIHGQDLGVDHEYEWAHAYTAEHAEAAAAALGRSTTQDLESLIRHRASEGTLPTRLTEWLEGHGITGSVWTRMEGNPFG